MKPASFEYIPVQNVSNALAALAEIPGSKILAGGQSLVPLMNFRLSRPPALVDINAVTELCTITVMSSSMRLGALVRHQQLVDHPDIRRTLPLLATAAEHIGHFAIRNRGSLGGSLAHADPAAELPAALVALNAEFTLASRNGRRQVRARDFFRGYFTTALAEDEMLVDVVLPLSESAFGFAEVARRDGDFALAGAICEWRQGEAALTWFGIGGAPHYVPMEIVPDSEEKRRQWWRKSLGRVEHQADAHLERIAEEMAERAYGRARRGGTHD